MWKLCGFRFSDTISLKWTKKEIKSSGLIPLKIITNMQ